MGSRRTFLVVMLILMTVLISESANNFRIWGGDDATAGKYPWVASVRVDGIHVCSGSIIANYYIISAAHCVSGVERSRLTARVGSINQFAGGQIVKIESIVIHPNYRNFLNDIALLKVDQTLKFNDKVSKIALAAENDVINEGTSVSVTGWGLKEAGSSPYKLHHLSMSVLSNFECENQAGYGYDSIICLAHPENRGICQGDGGAGVFSENKLFGVVSFYFGSCGTIYPDVSTKISYYSSWINEVVSQD